MERLFCIKYNGEKIRMLKTNGEEPDVLIKKMFEKEKNVNIENVFEIKKVSEIPAGHLIEIPYNESVRSCAEIIAGFYPVENIFI